MCYQNITLYPYSNFFTLADPCAIKNYTIFLLKLVVLFVSDPLIWHKYVTFITLIYFSVEYLSTSRPLILAFRRGCVKLCAIRHRATFLSELIVLFVSEIFRSGTNSTISTHI